MKVEFLVTFDIDPGELEREAQRRGLTPKKMLISVVSECEGRIVNSLRPVPGVSSIGSTPKCGTSIN